MSAGSQGRTGTFTEHRPSDGLNDIFRGGGGVPSALSYIRSFAYQPMLIGYMRISKANGSQTLDLQHDALLAVGLAPDQQPARHWESFFPVITHSRRGAALSLTLASSSRTSP